MPAHGDINMRTGGGRTPGANTQLLYNSAGVDGANANLTYNIASQLMSVEGNVRVANSNNLVFGGGQSNTIANSHFAVSYNATAQSLDFVFLGA